MSELRSMKGLIEQRFGALAFMEKLQKSPRQAKLSQRLLDVGFSPALSRKLCDALPDDARMNACYYRTEEAPMPNPPIVSIDTETLGLAIETDSKGRWFK